jgi:hypothetical protein
MLLLPGLLPWQLLVGPMLVQLLSGRQAWQQLQQSWQLQATC